MTNHLALRRWLSLLSGAVRVGLIEFPGTRNEIEAAAGLERTARGAVNIRRLVLSWGLVIPTITGSIPVGRARNGDDSCNSETLRGGPMADGENKAIVTRGPLKSIESCALSRAVAGTAAIPEP